MTRHAWLLIPLAALVYPLAVLAGDSPRFPTRAECVHAPRAGAQLEAVFGRFDRQDAAAALLARVQKLGFKGSALQDDGCGLLEVAVGGIPTIAVGGRLVAEARAAGLRPTLESAAP